MIGAAEEQQGHSIGTRQEAALDNLCVTLDAEFAARSSASERSEMPELEARDVHPLLERLCERSSPLTSSVPTSARIARLQAVEDYIGLPELRISDRNSTWYVICRVERDVIVLADVFPKKTPQALVNLRRQHVTDYDDAAKQPIAPQDY